MTPGQTSDAFRAKLRQAGARISDEQLLEAYGQIEASRRRFAAESISLGVLFVAKKECLGHGQWLPWCERFGKLAAPANLTVHGGASARTVRVYAAVAQHFLADLEQGSFQPERADEKVQPPAITAEQVLSLDVLPEKKRHEVTTVIEQWIGGRSLQRILIDFRRAEAATDQEQIDHDRQRKKKKQPNDPNQMDFLEDMLRPVGEIDALMADKTFVARTDKAFWTSLANKLQTQADGARALAKKVSA